MPFVLLALLALAAADVLLFRRPEAAFPLAVMILTTIAFAVAAMPYARRRARALAPEATAEPPVKADAAGSVTLIAPGERRSAPRPTSTERVADLDNTVLAIFATLGIAWLTVFIAPLSPNLALAMLVGAAAWVSYWAPDASRRHVHGSTVVINRDAATVFAFVSDFTNHPKFQYMYDLSVEKLTAGPIGAGTQFRSRVNLRAGVDPVRQNSSSEHIEEILEFEPNRRLTSSLVNGARPNFDVMTFEEVPGGTQVTQRFELVHSYVAAVLGGLLLRNREAERRVRTNRIAYWNRAKDILEGRQPVNP